MSINNFFSNPLWIQDAALLLWTSLCQFCVRLVHSWKKRINLIKITFTDSDPVEIICPDVKQPGEYFSCVVDIPTGHDLTAEVIMVDNVMLDQVQAEQYWAVSSKQDTFLPSKPEPMPCLFGPNLWWRI